MLKRLTEKRLELFKNTFPEYKVSKNGNYVFEKDVRRVPKTVMMVGVNVIRPIKGNPDSYLYVGDVELLDMW